MKDYVNPNFRVVDGTEKVWGEYELDEETMEALKRYASETGKPINEAFSELITAGIAQWMKDNPRKPC